MTPTNHQQQLGATILLVCMYGLKAKVFFYLAAAVVQSVRALVPQAEGLEFESQPRKT